MKKILLLTMTFCLLAVAALAQNKTDFSGDWELDKINSRMDERMRVESMTLKVQQTKKDLTVGTFTKRTIQADGGMNRGEIVPQAITYSLVEEITVSTESDTNSNARKASLGADGKLNLSYARKINTQTGEITINTKETWELADEGRTLKISRTTETPRGTQNWELVFTKKEATSASALETTDDAAKAKTISGGVLNGKSVTLVKPAYPEAAKAVKASGSVNVQVTIDEAGNVISAAAVSGHPLLRAAAADAALASKFSPTLLQGVPVKVTGIVVYNFVP